MIGMNKLPGSPVIPPLPTLLEQAENLLRGETPETVETLSPEVVRHLLHELRVHQIELETQNEELRRIQTELVDERARYFDLYDLAPIGYCTLSEAGLILQANLTAAIMLGVTRGSLPTQHLSRFICKADQDSYYLCRRRLIDTGQPHTCEVQMVKTDGTQFWVNLAATHAQDGAGGPTLRIALTEITQNKKLAVAIQESEACYRTLSNTLQEKNVELESARTLAEKASNAKSDFLSNMSHELRTPLSAILGFAQLLEAGTEPPSSSQKKSLDQIIKAGWYLLELINEILDLAQIESGKLPMSLEAVDLASVMHECLTLIESQAQMGGISVTTPAVEPPYFVRADRMRLKQALINLLSNAIKYNKPNGTVVVNCRELSPGRLRISVKDTGIGLAAEKLAQLFQPFNRLGQELNTVQGTGIGLVVCKRLVELMGGAIGVESELGNGSVFWIDLNLTTAGEEEGLAAQAAEPMPPSPAHVPDVPVRTLLYIEDNPANMELVGDLVARRPGIRFLSAMDGQNGIEMARALQPDVILMDINLPGISGIEALKILRLDPTTRHIPVVALTANAIPSDIENGLRAGFFSYLIKPIKINEFMETLDVAFKFAETTADARIKKQ